MPYTHFRYIAYQVPTATSPIGGGGVVCDYSPGDSYQAIGRLPVPAATPDDAKKRLQRLAGVVNLAANRLRSMADNATTLKIFMAPEFYFRPPSALGANYYSGTYPVKDRNALLDALNGMFVHADFQNWLFVPGTILWNTRDDPKANPLYFNTLVHVRGGMPDALNVIEKNQPSGIDGMPVVGIPARDAKYRIFHQSWANRKRHVSPVDGTPLGYDICLDHLYSPTCRILKNVIHDWQANEGNIQNVSLHILCAAGMDIVPGSLAARVNGFILRNDGICNPGTRSELKQVQRYQAPDPLVGHLLDTTPSDLTGTVTLGAAIAEESAAVLSDGPLQVPSKGPGFRTFPQRVVFYPTQALP